MYSIFGLTYSLLEYTEKDYKITNEFSEIDTVFEMAAHFIHAKFHP